MQIDIRWPNQTDISYCMISKFFKVYVLQKAVSWIRDILIRIRIRGFIPLTYGSGSGSGFFVCGWQDDNNKYVFFSWFVVYNFLAVYLHHSSKIISQKEIEQIVEIKVFLLSLHVYGKKGSGSRSWSVQIMTDPDPGGPI